MEILRKRISKFFPLFAKPEASNSCAAAARFGDEELAAFLLDAELETSAAAPRLNFATFLLKQT